MASLLLTAGEPGKRYALPNASIMIHQPSGGASGQASDIAIHAREILRVRERLNRMYQKHTGIREMETIGKREWSLIVYAALASFAASAHILLHINRKNDGKRLLYDIRRSCIIWFDWQGFRETCGWKRFWYLITFESASLKWRTQFPVKNKFTKVMTLSAHAIRYAGDQSWNCTTLKAAYLSFTLLLFTNHGERRSQAVLPSKDRGMRAYHKWENAKSASSWSSTKCIERER